MPSEGDEASDGVSIDGKLLSLRKQSGTLRVVSGRGLLRGDTAIVDFDARALIHGLDGRTYASMFPTGLLL